MLYAKCLMLYATCPLNHMGSTSATIGVALFGRYIADLQNLPGAVVCPNSSRYIARRRGVDR